MDTLAKALKIVDVQVEFIEQLSEEGQLDRVNTFTLCEFIKILLAANKDRREQIKIEDLDQKTEEEMDVLIKEATRVLAKAKRET